MPWKALSMYEQRLALIHRIVTLKQSVGEAALAFGVSRKTAHKWLARYRREESLADRSRRPGRSPGKTSLPLEAEVLNIRQRFNWGPRKIHRILSDQHQGADETPMGDLPPITRWKASARARPEQIPDPSGSVLRKVSQVGDIHYRDARILVGRALSRQYVRIEEREHDVQVYYSWKLVRVIPHDKLGIRSQKNQLI